MIGFAIAIVFYLFDIPTPEPRPQPTPPTPQGETPASSGLCTMAALAISFALAWWGIWRSRRRAAEGLDS